MLHQRNNVSRIVGDGKVGEIGIRLARGHIVVTIVAAGREVGCAHGLSQKTNADAATGAEKLVHQCGLLRGGEFVPDQPGGRIGQRTAEPIHLLILGRRVHGNDETARTSAGCESDAGLRLQQHGLVAGGFDDLHTGLRD